MRQVGSGAWVDLGMGGDGGSMLGLDGERTEEPAWAAPLWRLEMGTQRGLGRSSGRDGKTRRPRRKGFPGGGVECCLGDEREAVHSGGLWWSREGSSSHSREKLLESLPGFLQ